MSLKLSQPKSITSFKSIRQDWSECARCALGSVAHSHVLFEVIMPDGSKGKLAKVPLLFIGEAPGTTEDFFGRPFYGKSGKLLRECLQLARKETCIDFPVALTNVLACRPPNNRLPSAKEIEACKPRLSSTIDAFNPVAVCLLGETASENVSAFAQKFRIQHPAYILRLDTERSKRRYVKDIINVLEETVNLL